ncbi:MAG: elongation factor P maturation arginine rhamnosyltransferase EarP [Aquabacterium sp.]
MLWDVFCRVVDNFGDIGVCWRLAADLGARGHQVRLWVDDASALQWMAPQVRWHPSASMGLLTGQGQANVEVCRWQDAERDAASLPGLQAGDVVVEAFGCDPPEAFVMRMQQRATQGKTPVWVNLEYLSAEDYVERSHGLRSPVWSGPGAGLSKRFFYPGFTPATGGLLREPGLIEQGLSRTEAERLGFLASLGVQLAPADKAILIFCYDSAPVGELLDRLDGPPAASDTTGATHVLLAPGQATRLARARRPTHPASALAFHELAPLPQADFDRILWSCDLNFVRGEDSAVRALWAGRPHIWQIYEQDDGVHAAKLGAFMDRWMAAWPADLRHAVRGWWLAWNRLAPMPEALPEWRSPDGAWRQASEASRTGLLAQKALAGQLLDFVTSSG